MTRKRIVVAGLAILAAGAATAAAYTWHKQRPIWRAQELVKAALNDPESAQFREVYVNPKTGAACGVVNAKNRMGGYVGFTSFIAEADGRVTFKPKDADEVVGTEAKLVAVQDLIRYYEWVQRFCEAD